MKHRNVIGLIALVMLLACLVTIPVLAQQPCQFKGTVTLDGASVAAGTPITAELDGTEVGSTTAYIDGGVSKYNMIVPEVGGVPAENDPLKFYVNGYLGGTSNWNTGATKTLNLPAVTGPAYTLTVTVSPTGKGTVSKSPSMAQYPAGTTVTLTANAIAGWDFDYWSGAAYGTNPTVQVIMNSNKSVTAHFEREGAPPANFASWLHETFVECLID